MKKRLTWQHAWISVDHVEYGTQKYLLWGKKCNEHLKNSRFDKSLSCPMQVQYNIYSWKNGFQPYLSDALQSISKIILSVICDIPKLVPHPKPIRIRSDLLVGMVLTIFNFELRLTTFNEMTWPISLHIGCLIINGIRANPVSYCIMGWIGRGLGY